MKTILLNNIAAVLSAVFVILLIGTMSYQQGVVDGKSSAHKTCAAEAEKICDERKAEFKLNYCEMPPLVVTEKLNITSEDN
jgi:nitrate reductase cytochrome c-type subunit